MKKTYRVAFGGIITALGIVCMMLTGVFPFADYALPAIAGLLLVAVVLELNSKWALVVYAATAILSFFVSYPESAVLYTLFFGYYGILKAKLESTKSRVLEWCLKFGVFNAAVLLAYFALIYLFDMTEILNEFGELGQYGIYIFWALGNVVFLLYDIALTRVITFYVQIFRERYLKRLR